MMVIMATSIPFVSMIRTSKAIKNKADPSNEAYVVMDHMARVLRFANPAPSTPPDYYVLGDQQVLKAGIEGDHIGLVPSYVWCYYHRDTATNNFYFSTTTYGVGEGTLLSQHCTDFDAAYDAATRELWIKLTFDKDGSPITTETTIKVLGE